MVDNPAKVIARFDDLNDFCQLKVIKIEVLIIVEY
jgi:hypothetical protein